MAQFGSTPFGFEDGQITEYQACLGRLVIRFEFWNEERGELLFEGFAGLRDNGAIGATIGSTTELSCSDLIMELAAQMYEKPPSSTGWKHFRFLDVDDRPVFDVVSERCIFVT